MNLEEAAKLSHADWQARAAALKASAETRLFIGGEFLDAVEGGTFESTCPVDGSVHSRQSLQSGKRSGVKH